MAYFFKERNGKKPNTIRKVDWKDKRFQALAKAKGKFGKINRPKFITIVEAANKKLHFTRRITDVSFWDGFCIISWKHEAD
jgi:hypothetical protein